MIKKLIAIVTTVACISMVAVPSANAMTADELQAQITALTAQLNALTTQLGSVSTTTTTTAVTGVTAGFTFTKSLYLGMSNTDVKNLQIVLNSDAATKVAASGTGSAGYETMYFGNLTKAAVIKFQEKYASETLAPLGLTTGTGYVGAKTIAKLNAILAAGTTTTTTGTTTTTTTTTTTGTTTTGTTAVTTSGLTVALASSNPASATIVADSTTGQGAQSLIPALTIKVTNGDASEVKVTKLVLKRTGISADSDISQAYLMDGATKLAEYTSFTSSILTFSNSAGLFTVAAGASKEVTLKMDLANDTASGKTIKFSIEAATSVTTNASAVSGTFPVSGNVMSTAQASDLGRLTFTEGTDPSATVDPQDNFEVLAFTLAAADQNLNVEKIKVTNIGSTAAADLTNFKIYDGTTQIGSTVASMDTDKTVTFDLSNSPLAITKGLTKNIYVKADISGGTNRTFQLQIQEMTDILVKDTQYGVYVKPNGADSWTIVGSDVASTVNTGALTVTKSSTSASGNIAKDGTNVAIAKFDVKATGEDVKITSLITRVYGTVGTNDLADGSIYFDGEQKGATADLNTAATDVTGADTTFTFGNTLVVPAGTTKTLEIRANIKRGDDTAWDGNETMTAKIQSFVATGKTSSASVTSATQSGNQLTIKTGTLSAAFDNAVPSWVSALPTGVTGANEVLVASFVVTAGASEGSNITAIKLGDTGSAFTNLQNVKVYKGTKATGTQIGSTQGTLTAGSAYTFYPSPYISVAKSGQFVVSVYADIKTGLSAGSKGSIDLDQVSGTGTTTNGSVDYTTSVTGQTIYVSAAGTLTTAAASDNPKTAQLVMGTTGVEFLKTKLTAGAAEDVNIDTVVVTATLGAGATTSTIQNIKLYNGTTQIGSTMSGLADAGTVTFDLSASPLVVAAGTENTVLTVKADVQGYPYASSSATIALSHAVTTGIVGKGAVSGSAVTGTAISGNTMYTYKTTVTAAKATTQPTLSVPSSNDSVLYFTLTNNGGFDATFNAATFTVSYRVGTGNTTTSAERTFNLYESSDTTTAIGTGTIAAGTTINAATVAINVNPDLAIPAGQTKTYILKGDLSDCGSASGSSVGSSIRFYINAGTDLNWSDGVTGTIATTLSKTFPVDGNTFVF